MRWVTFSVPESDDRPRLGVVVGNSVIDLMKVAGVPDTMLELLQAGPPAWAAARARLERGEAGRIPLAEVRLHAPLPRPESIRDFYAFEGHVRAAFANRGREIPPEWFEFPAFYFSNAGSVVGPETAVSAPPGARDLDYELEVACVIGLGPAKGKDFATSLGPWIVTPDELADRSTGRQGVYDLAMIRPRQRSRALTRQLARPEGHPAQCAHHRRVRRQHRHGRPGSGDEPDLD